MPTIAIPARKTLALGLGKVNAVLIEQFTVVIPLEHWLNNYDVVNGLSPSEYDFLEAAIASHRACDHCGGIHLQQDCWWWIQAAWDAVVKPNTLGSSAIL